MMILVRWDDRGKMINQEKADEDVADEVSRPKEVARRNIILKNNPDANLSIHQGDGVV